MAEIRHQISIHASPEKVYAAIATSDGLRGWWTADSATDEKVGGKAEFGFANRAVIFRMNIEKRDADRELVWRCTGDQGDWTGTLLTWRLSPDADGTILRFVQSEWKSYSDYCAMCNSTWGELMYRLKAYVEGKTPGPHWRE